MAGFYGNITNTARTQFQFDKIYPNRYTMDRNVNEDGVYVGRYVLVEYDQDYVAKDNFTEVFIDENGTFKWYYNGASRLTAITRYHLGTFTFDGQKITPIVFVEETNEGQTTIKFYKVTSPRDFDNAGTAEVPTFEIATIINGNSSNYGKNFNIDKITYGTDRGFDSTVWMKSYIDGNEKYIMIAELNTVVPTFTLYAEAPSLSPIKPHFDEQQTNLFYPLHMQTNWGFRVAAADATASDLIADGWSTNGETNYRTNETVTYTKSVYDENTKQYKTKDISYNGAIYYNQDGFNKSNNNIDNITRNKISLTATGISGNKYNEHPNTYDKETNEPLGASAPDILELSIMLPAIGNAVAEMWNVVYGTDRRLNTKYQYIGEIDNSQKTDDLNTLAGCINDYHTMLGQIISKVTNKPNIDSANYDLHYIYEYNDRYYYIHKNKCYDKGENNENTIGKEKAAPEYVWTEIPDFKTNITSIYRLILDIKQILATSEELKNTRDRDTIQGCINTINDIINLFENQFTTSSPLIVTDKKKIASAKYTTEQKVTATNWGTNETSVVEEKGQWISCNVNGIDKIISINHTSNTIESTENRSDVNGNGNVINIKSPIVDNAGHIVGQHTEEITLPFGYKSIGVGVKSISEANAPILDDNSLSLIAINTQDHIALNSSNKWIGISATDIDNKHNIKIGHMHSGVSAGNYGLEENANTTDGDITFNIPYLTVDKAGHITAINNTQSITLPKIVEVKLDNYNSDQDDISILSANDNIVTAFSKLQLQISNEVVAREADIAAEQKRAEGIEQGLDSRLTQAEIDIDDEKNNRIIDIDNLQGQISSNDTDISNLNNKIDETVEEMTSAIAAETSAREEVIKGLSFNLTCNDNEYISSIEQIDGKINAAKTIFTFPDYSDEWGRITVLESDLKAANATIADLTAKIKALESSINSLTERVAKLEPTEPTPDPDAPETETE